MGWSKERIKEKSELNHRADRRRLDAVAWKYSPCKFAFQVFPLAICFFLALLVTPCYVHGMVGESLGHPLPRFAATFLAAVFCFPLPTGFFLKYGMTPL